MSETKVINLRNEEADTIIDRSTIFGNPFKLKKDGGDYTREESIEKYREWFYDKIENDKRFKREVEELKGDKLGCWCKPKACHGDVIIEYLEDEADCNG